MKIATWNINGIRARIEPLRRWVAEAAPDVVCLQEVKSADDVFPHEVLDGTGYNVAVHGQKGFNGVAILAKRPIEDVVCGLPGDPDDLQARYIEATVAGEHGVARVASIYLPNGNPVGSDKFPYKLAWMDRLIARARARLDLEEPLVLAGDYNVIPMPEDARYPENWVGDAVRATMPDSDVYTFWDYQAAAWQRNNGIRIDHLLLSPQAADRMVRCGIDKETRGWDKPSDHVPVWVDLDI